MTYFKGKQVLFEPGQNGSGYYRIPSLLCTQTGRLLAVCDRRLDRQEDWGRIHLSLRTSDDGGETWSQDQIIVKAYEGKEASAFVIDACMLEDKQTNTIHLMVDMFPHSKGFFSANELKDSHIYHEKGMLRLHRDHDVFWVDDKGQVYDENMQILDEWTIQFSQETEMWGDIYQGEERKGNILVPNEYFMADKTVHLWHFTSQDDGDSWQFQADITSQVREDWMYFLGVAPGTGLQLNNGRLCVPVYFTNKNLGYSQSSAIIYSDDHGLTWHCSASPNDCRLNTKTMKDLDSILTESQICFHKGNLYLFMRNYQGKVQVSTSSDYAETWTEPLTIDVTDPYCQMSVVSDGNYIYLSNPKGPNRQNGRLTILDDLKPVAEFEIQKGPFEYSCLAYDSIRNKLHILYETKVLDDKMHLYYAYASLETFQKGV